MVPRRIVKRVAVYPGTFDPLTLGHIDIISRAVKLVDKLVIGVATNAAKHPIFSLEERVEMIRFETHKIAEREGIAVVAEPFEGLLVDFAKTNGAGIIVRGLRAVSDFEYEFQMVGMNQRLDPDIETVFLMADPMHQAIASRLVKEIACLGGDVSSFVSPRVAKLLKKRCRKSGGKP
jgi:pantetheine-phosphate adenylyltransferase